MPMRSSTNENTDSGTELLQIGAGRFPYLQGDGGDIHHLIGLSHLIFIIMIHANC